LNKNALQEKETRKTDSSRNLRASINKGSIVSREEKEK